MSSQASALKRLGAPSAHYAPQQAGFTLTELIATMLVLAVLAVVLIPRMSSMNAISERAERDKVLSAIQYARKTAVSTRRYACVSVSAKQVSLTIDTSVPEATAVPFGGNCPFATVMPLPSADPACAASNQTCVRQVTLSASPSSFQFDARGRASATVAVSVSGFPVIRVEGETGYVH
jgi:MSHA pilin protein MshC